MEELSVTAIGGRGWASWKLHKWNRFRYQFKSGNLGQKSGSGFQDGQGGQIKVLYADLTGLTTIDVSIGSKGNGAQFEAGDGGDGMVIMEYAS